jgi:hypothetical protein
VQGQRDGRRPDQRAVPAGAGAVPDRSGFSWTVLSAVADEMHVTSGGGTLAIRFTKFCDSLQR